MTAYWIRLQKTLKFSHNAFNYLTSTWDPSYINTMYCLSKIDKETIKNLSFTTT